MELEDLFSGLDRYGLDPVTYQYFHQLLEKRTVLLNCDVSDEIVERVFLPLKEFEEDNSNEPVTLILNSSGGSVSDGFFLAHYISQYSKPLNILVPGYACSMAAVILAGGGKNENVIAIIGDGSLSGGEALEGLNVAGSEINSNLIINSFFRSTGVLE